MVNQYSVTVNGRTPLFAERIMYPAAIRSTLIGLLMLIFQVSVLMGQTGGGATLVGTVKDGSGSIVAGAKVRVINTETSFLTETTTQTDGSYYVPYLTPGNYRVTVNASGFKEFVRDSSTIDRNEIAP